MSHYVRSKVKLSRPIRDTSACTPYARKDVKVNLPTLSSSAIVPVRSKRRKTGRSEPGYYRLHAKSPGKAQNNAFPLRFFISTTSHFRNDLELSVRVVLNYHVPLRLGQRRISRSDLGAMLSTPGMTLNVPCKSHTSKET